MSRAITGVGEWANSKVNISQGCANDCRYCYAREIAVRYRRKTTENWHVELINERKAGAGYGYRKGVVMFPTTHDITPGTVHECCRVLRRLADAGNRILIVSKPRPGCMGRVFDTLRGHRERVEFRFTIGALDDSILGYWEPNAPKYFERRRCLMIAKAQGFKTSVSIEPMLDAPHIDDLISELEIDVTGTIWVGKMNQIGRRVDTPNTVFHRHMVNNIVCGQVDSEIKAIYERHHRNPKLRWKDSIKRVVKLPLATKAGEDK